MVTITDYIMANHSIILTSCGLYGCGENHCGTISIVRDGTFLETPKLLLFALPVSDIVLGKSVTIINSEGRLFVAGCNKHGQLGVDDVRYINIFTELYLPYIVRKVATSGEHTIIINEFGGAYGFGSNLFGQLGVGDGHSISVPTKIPLAREATDVACGSNYTAFNCGGQLYVCGMEDNGRIGITTSVERKFCNALLSPTHIPFDAPVTHISCGWSHTIVNANGLYITGEFMYGPRMRKYLRTPKGKTTTFTKIPFDLPVSKIVSGYSHVVILSNNDLYAFGSKHVLCQNRSELCDIIKIPFKDTIDDVVCGSNHTIIYSDDDRYGFGSNMEHQLGIPKLLLVKSPTLLALPLSLAPPVISNKRFRNTKSALRTL